MEKSNDGLNFKKVNTTPATGASSSLYKWIDENPVTGNNYYRVRSIGNSGKFDYSKTVLVKISAAATTSGIAVFPNPSKGDVIGLALKNKAAGKYGVSVANALGQTLHTIKLDHATGVAIENIYPGSKLPSGTYDLVVMNPDGSAESVKVIVQ